VSFKDVTGTEYQSVDKWLEAVREKASDPNLARYDPAGPRKAKQVAGSAGASVRDPQERTEA
jgi:hypothetical protein